MASKSALWPSHAVAFAALAEALLATLNPGVDFTRAGIRIVVADRSSSLSDDFLKSDS
jgi:hypothetical protein